jgi:hypothetical protein
MWPKIRQGLRFVCSDMWKPYLQVFAAQAGQALHILNRFHITGHLNQAVDEVRRAESTRLRAKSKSAARRLKHMRWCLLRRGSRVRGRARQWLDAVLASKAGDCTGLGFERDQLNCRARAASRLLPSLERCQGHCAHYHNGEETHRLIGTTVADGTVSFR